MAEVVELVRLRSVRDSLLTGRITMKRNRVLGLLLACVACAPAAEHAPADSSEVNAAAEAFLGYAHAFDYATMRANSTPDFEILIFGQRLSMDGFVDLLRGMEERREGRPLSDYELEDFNTKIAGDVAYTTWRSPNWLESAIFVRIDDRWIMDRAASVPVPNSP